MHYATFIYHFCCKVWQRPWRYKILQTCWRSNLHTWIRSVSGCKTAWKPYTRLWWKSLRFHLFSLLWGLFTPSKPSMIPQYPNKVAESSSCDSYCPFVEELLPQMTSKEISLAHRTMKPTWLPRMRNSCGNSGYHKWFNSTGTEPLWIPKSVSIQTRGFGPLQPSEPPWSWAQVRYRGLSKACRGCKCLLWILKSVTSVLDKTGAFLCPHKAFRGLAFALQASENPAAAFRGSRWALLEGSEPSDSEVHRYWIRRYCGPTCL